MFSKKKRDDDIGPSRGLKGLMHKFAMFFLYPLRKPVRFFIGLIVLLAIIYTVPLFLGAKPKEVHTWYLEKYNNFDVESIKEMMMPKPEEKGTDVLVEISSDPQPIRRQSFGRASSSVAPQPVDILAESSDDIVRIETIIRKDEIDVTMPRQTTTTAPIEVKTTDEKGVVSITKKTDETIKLAYLNETKEISGTARVVNANELVVGDTYIFLHGIYSNPRNERGVRAGVFLKNSLKGQTVRCEIIAQVEDAVTAECFVDDISINNVMVERGFSDKVSLQ